MRLGQEIIWSAWFRFVVGVTSDEMQAAVIGLVPRARAICKWCLFRIAGPSPPRQVRVAAVTIWILSRKPHLGLCYVLSRRSRYDLGDVDLSAAPTAALLLASYLEDAAIAAQVLLALGSLDNKHRIVADTFLIQSLLVEHVVEQNRRGIALDLEEAIGKYIRLWACRPMSQEVERRLALLVWNRNARRRFGVDLRREWCLAVSTFSAPRDLRPHEIRRRVTHVSYLSVSQTYKKVAAL